MTTNGEERNERIRTVFTFDTNILCGYEQSLTKKEYDAIASDPQAVRLNIEAIKKAMIKAVSDDLRGPECRTSYTVFDADSGRWLAKGEM